MDSPETQRQQIIRELTEQPLARARDLKAAGISATAISRAVATGDIIRIHRGLYQLPEPEFDSQFTLVEASKRVPNGTICLISALAFHGLTDQMPRRVWMAIAPKAWKPSVEYPPLRIVRFQIKYLQYGIEMHTISGTPVPIFSVAKSLADAFRNPKMLDRSVAIECLRNALERRVATPAQIADAAQMGGAWKRINPYLEALTSNG